MHSMRIFRWNCTSGTFLSTIDWTTTPDGILCDIFAASDKSNGFPRYITHCTDVPIQLAQIGEYLVVYG